MDRDKSYEGNIKRDADETGVKVNLQNCRIISSTNFNAQFSLFIKNMFVTLLSSTCFEH